MYRKILIANRGEIALRVIQACRELGIRTVAVHSTADRDSLHVTYADEDICIGPPPSKDSYLDISRIVAAAEITGAEAIHPGYGFLSENAHFAEVLAACKIGWIGPSPDTIRRMGNKSEARRTAAAAGVPTVPGSPGPLESAEDAKRLAAGIGYPVILKASAGGGGRGMRIVEREDDLEASWRAAAEEALRAFGDGSVYLEKYLVRPRHVEFQVFGDRHGRVAHLGERECSIQRRHQKLIEEAPSPALDQALRERMGAAAVALCEAVGYVNAGTIEFLVDHDGSFYFMEMNTRIQVEHPVTEAVLGVDLVKEQILVSLGEKLSFPTSMAARGHAIECRINAEDPTNFRPSPGRISTFHAPGGPGVRVDTHAYEGYVVPPHYDSLVAKLICWGRNRGEAIARMERALDFFVIEGISTSIALHRRVLADDAFRRGEFSTRFMESFLAAGKQSPEPPA